MDISLFTPGFCIIILCNVYVQLTHTVKLLSWVLHCLPIHILNMENKCNNILEQDVVFSVFCVNKAIVPLQIRLGWI